MSIRSVRPYGYVLIEIALTLCGALGMSLPLAIVIIWVCG
jgi:hypothetical protein